MVLKTVYNYRGGKKAGAAAKGKDVDGQLHGPYANWPGPVITRPGGAGPPRPLRTGPGHPARAGLYKVRVRVRTVVTGRVYHTISRFALFTPVQHHHNINAEGPLRCFPSRRFPLP